MKQTTLTGFEKYRKTTRRAQFLADMQVIVPWSELTAEVEPFYPKISEAGGRPPLPLERMLRVSQVERSRQGRARVRSDQASFRLSKGVLPGGPGEEPAQIGSDCCIGKLVLVAQETAECVANVSAKAAQRGFSRRHANPFPRKRSLVPDPNEIPMPSLPSYPVFQTFLKMDRLVVDTTRVEYHWTLTGTNTGPSGTGKHVRVSGFEVWQFDADGLIAESKGHFDKSEYDRQLAAGLP